MIERSGPRVTFWPFILVDALFLALACLIFFNAHRPLSATEVFGLIVCAALGAWSFLTPFLKQEAADLKLAESKNLTTTLAQIQDLQQVAAQIAGATQHLQGAQEESKKTMVTAQEIARKMTEEGKAFGQFLQKANDSEKAHLRLEVDKLRRSEVDWIQITVHILDQVFALHAAALRSGKQPLIEQIGNFQSICRDAARRIGLTASSVDGSMNFNETLHQVVDGAPQPDAGAPIRETLAPGYSYQGRIVRRAVVRVVAGDENSGTKEEVAAAQDTLL